jgi:hypothetical protein
LVFSKVSGVGRKLENPLVQRCRNLADQVASGQTDGHHAAELVIMEAKAISDALEPRWRSEFLSEAADQVDAAADAYVDHQIFVDVAAWLRGAAADGRS